MTDPVNSDAALVREARAVANSLRMPHLLNQPTLAVTVDALIAALGAAAERADEADGWIRESRKAVRLARTEALEIAVDLQRAEATINRLREALDEIHEFHCGCDKPGDPAKCIADPTPEFVALAQDAEQAGD